MAEFIYQQQRYFYREAGVKSDRPIILILHGNTASSALHQKELEFFSSLGYHAVAFDFLGCGQSERIHGPWPLDWWQQNCRAAAHLAGQLGYAKMIPVGTSGGAITALFLALEFPDRVPALIADSEYMIYPPGFFQQTMHERSEHTPGQVGFWSAAHGADWEAVVDADTDFLLRLEAAYPDGIDLYQGRLKEIRCPALFTASLKDNLLPDAGSQALEMARQVPGSWLFLVNEGSHPLMWSQSQAFQAAARSFLAGVSQ